MVSARKSMKLVNTAGWSSLDEPVRRYFEHALPAGAPEQRATRLSMRGRLKVGMWMDFDATWRGDGRSFEWDARAGLGRLRPLRALDRYENGQGSMRVTLLGRATLADERTSDTARSAAARTAIEAAVWAPASLLPDRDVSWRAESETRMVASWPVPPEAPEVTLRTDASGAVQSVVVDRWRDDAYVPFGATVRGERTFDRIRIPSELTVCWWFGTAREEPFFEARVTAVADSN